MKIFVLEHLLKQTHKKSFSRVTLDKIYNELETLLKIEKEGYNTLRKYLNSQHDRQLKGTENVLKFELTDGDRILYTHGENLPYIDDPNSIVLLAYATHDKQGYYKKLPGPQNYADAEILIKKKHEITDEDIKDLCDDDLDAFLDLIFENSYHDSHVICVVDDEALLQADIKDLDKLLSRRQGQIIDTYNANPSPTLILGGAGTGKTLLAVHLLNDRVTDKTKKYAYFTQSRALLGKVETQYKTITHEKELSNVHFRDINEFCLEILKKKRINFVETTQFLDFVRNTNEIQKILLKNKLTELDLWTEIRGVIKGLTKPDWTKTNLLNQQSYRNGNIIKELDSNGLLKRNINNPQLFELVPDFNSICVDNLSREAKLLFQEIKDYFKSFDASIKEISFEDYLELSDELTMVEPEKRKSVYDAYLIYKKWLGQQNKFDDNDLALETIKLVQEGNLQKYDFTVIDEVQDYTENQIYLLRILTKDEHFFVLAGDVHQIINPTVFNERKLMRLFSSKLCIEYLEQNFRCQQKVVEIGNQVALIRQKKIAKGKHEIPEYSERDGRTPGLLNYNKTEILKLFEHLLHFPGVAILVPEEKTKQELIEMIGSEKYKAAKNSIIYTISEIKGMEYKYVVSYNMLSTYSNFWHLIMNDTSVAKVTRFRYYFNLFYVSITRAMEYLCLIESDSNNDLLKSVIKSVEISEVIKFSKSALSLDLLANDGIDWMSDAEENEKSGNYEKAKESYLNAGASIENIWRCDAEISVNQRDFETAIKYFILLNNEKRIKQYFEELDNESIARKVSRIYLYPTEFGIKNEMKKESIIEWTNFYFGEEDENKFTFMKNILDKLQTEYIRMVR